MMSKGKIIRYFIVVFCVIAILFAFMRIASINKKLSTYLALGDYLSVSGEIKGKKVTSFTRLLQNYFLEENLVENVNNDYTFSSVTSSKLLAMINKDSYNNNGEGLVSVIKDSKYITISVGMNDIIEYIRFDSGNNKVVYDKEFIKRKLEIMKQNYYEIVEEIKEINADAGIYLVGYYFPFNWVDDEFKDEVNEVFGLLNDSIKEVSELMSVNYVDISGVSEERNMINKKQIYLNQEGHNFVFDLFKDKYFSLN